MSALSLLRRDPTDLADDSALAGHGRRTSQAEYWWLLRITVCRNRVVQDTPRFLDYRLGRRGSAAAQLLRCKAPASRELVSGCGRARRGVGAVLLADEFFLFAYDDLTGRRRVSRGTVDLGLAGALLAELMLPGHVTIDSGHLVVRNPWPIEDPATSVDALGCRVLHQLVVERTVTAVRDWLHYLARDAYDRVGQRLLRAGSVRARYPRWSLRTTVIYEPADMNVAAWPLARLAGHLQRRESLSPGDLLLAGLITATGLHGYLLDSLPPAAGPHLRALLARLAVPRYELLAETEAAVGDAVLTHRR